MPYKIFLANGCSHTLGEGMDDSSHNFPSKFAWPQMLGNKLNTKVKNISAKGGSNSRILRTTIKETINLLQVNDSKDILIGIMLAHPTRHEFPFGKMTEWKNLTNGTLRRSFDDETIGHRDFIETLMVNYRFGINTTLSVIHHLQLFFDKHNIDYFLMFSDLVFVSNDDGDGVLDLDEFSYLSDAIDWGKFYFIPHNYYSYYSFMDWAKDNNYPTAKCGHFLESASKDFAELVLYPWVETTFTNTQ